MTDARLASANGARARCEGAVSVASGASCSRWVRNATASPVEGAGAGEAEAPPAPDAETPARRRRHRPLYRRLFHYARTAWTGVKFALGNTNVFF